MNTEATMTGYVPDSAEAKKTFAVCFAALVATSFCFILRAFSIDAWGVEFALTKQQLGELNGVGLWPFAISIVLLSLIVDRVGFKALLWFAAFCHIAGLVLILQADGYWSLYWGTFVLSLGNGAVEAGINPLVATQFRHDKVTWLNRLHAGWPAGFVLGGLLALALPGDMSWRMKMMLILIPVITYSVMLLARRFPQSERVSAGVSYRDMLAEAGWVSALVVASLIVLEMGRVVAVWMGIEGDPSVTFRIVQIAIILAITAAYAYWARSPGRPFFILMILVMIPLATTELGTDGWISSMMAPAMSTIGLSGGWVLIYTMSLVLVLRLFAGPIVHKFSPVGLLAISAVIAAIGLVWLSASTGIALLAAATFYGIGKAFFWPTSLGVVAEQSPRGGAITLNVVAGVGMLGVGIVGSVLIGAIQDGHMKSGLADYDKSNGTTLESTLVTKPNTSVFGSYLALDSDKVAGSAPDIQAVVKKVDVDSKLDALRTVAVLPLIMFLCYLGMILYFRGRGGYKPVVLEYKK